MSARDVSVREVAIRAAGESDLPAVLRLYGQPEVDDGQILELDVATAIFRRFANYPNYRLFVAEIDDHVVGSYALLVMDNLGHMGAPSAIAEDVMVDPRCQGHGVGQAMMEHAMKVARAAGAYKLVLSSNVKRERAHAFYERLGFVRHGYSFVADFSQ